MLLLNNPNLFNKRGAEWALNVNTRAKANKIQHLKKKTKYFVTFVKARKMQKDCIISDEVFYVMTRFSDSLEWALVVNI